MVSANEMAVMCRGSFPAFVKAINPFMDVGGFHWTYYHILEQFAKGKIKKLIISMPPQHGKSAGSTINLPAYMLGLDPDKKIAIASYNTVFAQKFNRSVQRLIDSFNYALIFPGTSINAKNIVTTSSWLRNASEFEVINRKGGLKAVGRSGGLTGHSVDVMIMDDLYKDKMEAYSITIREAAWDWYTTVARTRLHNNSQELIVFTRWHEDDIVGRIEQHEEVVEIDDLAQIKDMESNAWVKINFPAIQDRAPRSVDMREIGEPLWEKRHSLEKLEGERKLDPAGFESLYQGNPQPIEGLLYEYWFKSYEAQPISHKVTKKCLIDTADEGTDYFCAVFYDEHRNEEDTCLGIYVTDVLFTQKNTDYTEPMTAKMLVRNNTGLCQIESNNGGRSIRKQIERQTRSLGNTKTTFSEFPQKTNKEARLFTMSADVQNMVQFPVGWELRWRGFSAQLKNMRKDGRNANDDAGDVLSQIVLFATEGIDYNELAAMQRKLKNVTLS